MKNEKASHPTPVVVADIERQARIVCDDTGCNEWNCDDCHPETKFHVQLAPAVVSAEETRLRNELANCIIERDVNFQRAEKYLAVLASANSSCERRDVRLRELKEKIRNLRAELVTALSAHPSPLPIGDMPKPSIPNHALAARCIHESESGVYTMAMELQAWRKWGKENAK